MQKEWTHMFSVRKLIWPGTQLSRVQWSCHCQYISKLPIGPPIFFQNGWVALRPLKNVVPLFLPTKHFYDFPPKHLRKILVTTPAVWGGVLHLWARRRKRNIDGGVKQLYRILWLLIIFWNLGTANNSLLLHCGFYVLMYTILSNRMENDIQRLQRVFWRLSLSWPFAQIEKYNSRSKGSAKVLYVYELWAYAHTFRNNQSGSCILMVVWKLFLRSSSYWCNVDCFAAGLLISMVYQHPGIWGGCDHCCWHSPIYGSGQQHTACRVVWHLTKC